MKKNKRKSLMHKTDNTLLCKQQETTESDGLNILEALDRVQEKAKDSQMSEEFQQECRKELDYLQRRLELTTEQVVLVAIMCEIGESMSWRRFGDFLGQSRLKTMSLTPALEGLLAKRWAYQCAASEGFNRFDGFKLVRGIINAFRHNKNFEPEKIDGLSEQVFVDRLARYCCQEGRDRDIPREENHRYIFQLVEANPELPLCREVMNLTAETSKITLLITVVDYACYAGTDDEGVCLNELNNWIIDGGESELLTEQLQDGTHELFERGLLKHGCQDGLVDNERYLLTKDAKEELLGNFTPHRRRRNRAAIIRDNNIRKATGIESKVLFFNAEERRQLDRLESLLGGDGLENVQQRLADGGLRRGITCLFYGAPGTGKTESALQLARRSGRDIMQIDIAGLRDKFVGESEKNIQQIFSDYRELCKNSERIPILLFNEADAVINNRFTTTRSSVEKMDNAMQNIILQELEDLEGILIATTNLTGTLDKAFDRRFLFKIEFMRPEVDTRSEIWNSMLPDIGMNNCRILAREFDFSGGQIENIVRKYRIEQAVTGLAPDLPAIREFCKAERLNRDITHRIGF